MIISASRRTDIPSYYSDWFIQRLKEGYVLTRNPMNFSQVSYISLAKDVVDCIVFWTKDAGNMIDKLQCIDELGYKYCFQYTITPYDSDMECNLRDKQEIIKNFQFLSSKLGKNCMVWRYDPIIINDKYTVQYHIKAFEKMCEELSFYANRVIISFVDLYGKNRSNGIREVDEDTIKVLSKEFGRIAQNKHILIQTCCEQYDLSEYGIQKGGCVDINMIEKVCGYKLKIAVDKGQRKNCQCIESIDIGAYNTCLNDCIYCYANGSKETVRQNYSSHNSKAEFLLGERRVMDKINMRKQKSNKVTSHVREV